MLTRAADFVVSKETPTIITNLGYKVFFMFGTINILGMGTFSLLIPETKGRSLEEMDVIFGSVSAQQRAADVQRVEREMGVEGVGVGGVDKFGRGEDRLSEEKV